MSTKAFSCQVLFLWQIAVKYLIVNLVPPVSECL